MVRRLRCQQAIRRWSDKGASFVEVMVALAILLIVLFGVYLLYETSQITYARGAIDIELQDSGRKAVEDLARLLRMAGYDPTGTGSFGFRSITGFTSLATEDRILFSIDENGDGVIDSNTNERVGFALFDTELKWTMDGTTDAGLLPVAKNVQSARFSYFTASDVPIPNPPGATYTLTDAQRAMIRRIRISLTHSGTASSPYSQQARNYTLTMDVRPRNL